MLREYLVDGRSVRDFSVARGVSEAVIRAELGRAGVKVDPGRVRDPACAAIGWRGLSFAEYARANVLRPVADQARELGVEEADLERLYRLLRDLALMESGDGAAK